MGAYVNGVYDNAYISTSSLIEKRDIRKKIFPTYREDNLYDFLIHAGAKQVTDNETFNWFEEDLLYKVVQIESFTGTGADTPIVVTLEEADHEESGTLSPGLVGNDVMIFASGGVVKGRISAKSTAVDDAHTITIENDVAGVNLGTSVANGDYIAIFSSSYGDGSDEPESMVRKPIARLNYTQIFRNNYRANGSVSANKAEIEVANGQPYYFLKGEADLAMKHVIDMNNSFIFGEQSTRITDGNGETVYKTRGLESFIDNFGNTETYTTLAWADFQNMVGTLDLEGSPDTTLMLTGTTVDLAIEALLKTQAGEGGGLDFSAFGDGNGAQKAVDLGIRKFTVGGRTFLLKKFRPLNYKGISGTNVTDSPYPEMALGVPLAKVKDAKSGEMIDTISLRFKKGPKQERWMKHYVRDIGVTGKDQMNFNYLTEAGLQVPCAQYTIKLAK